MLDGIRPTIPHKYIPYNLPDNWTWYYWGDLIKEFKQGMIRSNKELGEGNVSYIKMGDLDGKGSHSFDNISIAEATDNEINEYKLNNNDFLINVRNSRELVGKTCVFRANGKATLYNHMLVKISHKRSSLNTFINAFLNIPSSKKLLDRCKQGTTTIIALYKRDLYELPIPIPDENTLFAITEIYNSINTKIDLNHRINTELEAMAKTLYDYWFVQFDFPDAEGKPYKSSGGAMVYNEQLKRDIPKGWEVGKASDIFDFNPTTSLKKGELNSYIDMGALPTKGLMTAIPQLKKFKGGTKFKNGDVVFARITPCLENGKTGLITLLGENEVGFGSTEFIVIRGKSMPLSGFAAYLSRSELFRKYAIINMTGTSGRKRVDARNLEVFPIAIPPKSLLEKFESITAPFFKKATSNIRQNDHLTQLRDWLLPMLMNGQVRVR